MNIYFDDVTLESITGEDNDIQLTNAEFEFAKFFTFVRLFSQKLEIIGAYMIDSNFIDEFEDFKMTLEQNMKDNYSLNIDTLLVSILEKCLDINDISVMEGKLKVLLIAKQSRSQSKYERENLSEEDNFNLFLQDLIIILMQEAKSFDLANKDIEKPNPYLSLMAKIKNDIFYGDHFEDSFGTKSKNLCNSVFKDRVEFLSENFYVDFFNIFLDFS